MTVPVTQPVSDALDWLRGHRNPYAGASGVHARALLGYIEALVDADRKMRDQLALAQATADQVHVAREEIHRMRVGNRRMRAQRDIARAQVEDTHAAAKKLLDAPGTNLDPGNLIEFIYALERILGDDSRPGDPVYIVGRFLALGPEREALQVNGAAADRTREDAEQRLKELEDDTFAVYELRPVRPPATCRIGHLEVPA